MKPLSALQRIGIPLFIIYLTFIGGTVYPQINIFLKLIHHIVITGVLLGWLLGVIFKRRGWQPTPFDMPLLLYAIWLGITALTADDPRVSLEQIWQYLIHILLFYWLVDLIRRGKIRPVLEGLFLSAGVMIIISLVEMASWYFGLGFAGFRVGWFQIGGLSQPIPPYIHRISLGLNVSTLLGNYAAVLSLLAVGWAIGAHRQDNRRVFFLMAAALAGITFFTGSRGAMLALVAGGGLIFGFWLLRRFSGGSQIKVSPYLVGGLMLVGVLAIGALILGISLRGGRSAGDQGRIDMWESALKITKASPVVGVGAYQYGVTLRDYRDPTIAQDKLVSAHNLWLNTAAETGLIGLGLLLWLMGIGAWVWWRAWEGAAASHQRHLEGIAAALIAFGVHSLVDTFTLTSLVLPILIAGAYVVADVPTRDHRAYKFLPFAVTTLLLGYFGWFMLLDLAGVNYFQSMIQTIKEDYPQALREIDRAQELDPNLRLYRLQEAYILGLMANDDPDHYLDRAIAAHLAVLRENPTYDLPYANLAALYAQKGDYAAAADAIQQATRIQHFSQVYYIKIAEYLEASGDQAGAFEAYLVSLSAYPTITRSDYWRIADPDSPRPQAIQAAYETFNAAQRAEIALNMGDIDQAKRAIQDLAAEGSLYYSYLVQGRLALSLQDYKNAEKWFSQVLEGDSDLVEAYTGRAEANFYLMNYTQADEDAHRALFISQELPDHQNRAYYILALLRLQDGKADDRAINDLLANGVAPESLEQSYTMAVYGRISSFAYLPQLHMVGGGQHAYEPWLLLAQRYAADDDEETDPAKVYQAILAGDDYVEAAHVELDRLESAE